MKHNLKYLLNVFLFVVLLTACGPNATTEPTGEATGATEAAVTDIPVPVGTPVVPTPDVAVDPNCNVLWSRLRIGDQAVLTYGDRPNRVRSEPAKDPNNVIAQIYSGTVVTVVDGPVCADGFVFWEVEHESIPGGSGWTAEGDGAGKHWLTPDVCGGSLYRNHYALVPPGIQGLRVYDKTGSNGQVIAKISAGALVKVVGNPYCTSTDPNLVYWQVESLDGTFGTGWVAEYGYENNSYVQYLRYYWEADPVAFPQPPSLDSVARKWSTVGSLELADLNNSGQIAYVADDWTWVVNADGTGAYELKNPLGSYATPSFLSWSPDGQYVTMVIGKKIYKLSVDKIDGALQAEEIVFPTQLYDYMGDVVWSFDSQYIAFAAGYEIFSIKTDGTDFHEISVEQSYCQSPTWSPYGIYLAYVCWNYGPSLYMSRVDGPGTQSFEAMGYIVAWSPDGKYLAYNDDEDGLSIVEASGAHAHTLVPEGSDSFAWSPDSQSIAFTYRDEIFLVDIADGTISNLTGRTVNLSFDWVDGALSWSPDGKYIVFEFQTYLFEDGYWKSNPIYILDVNTGAQAQLLDQGTLPVWSPVIEYPIVQLPDCSNGWTQLTPGKQAILLGDPTKDPPNRVRAEGSKSAKQTGVLYAGTVVDVLEGPVCADGMVYYKVTGTIYPADVNSTVVPPDVGWTAEGDLTEYWLAPYEP